MHGKVAITYFEWAGVADQRIVVPWRMIDGDATARAVADEIAAAPYAARLPHLDLRRAAVSPRRCSKHPAIAASAG